MNSKKELQKRFGKDYNSEEYVRQFEDAIFPLDKQTLQHLIFFKIALKHFDPKSKDLKVPFHEFKPLFPGRGYEVEFFLRFMAFVDDCFTEHFKKYPNNIGGSILVKHKQYKFEGGYLIFQFRDEVKELLQSPEMYSAVSNRVEKLVRSKPKKEPANT